MDGEKIGNRMASLVTLRMDLKFVSAFKKYQLGNSAFTESIGIF